MLASLRPFIPGRVLRQSDFIQNAGTGIPDPTRWTNAGGDGAFSIAVNSGNKLRMTTAAGSGNSAQIWCTQQRQPATDVGVLLLFSWATSGSCNFNISLRGNATEQGDGLPTNCYYLDMNATGTPGLLIVQRLASSDTTLASANLNLSQSELYWVRFEIVGARLSAKIWHAIDTPEPQRSGTTAVAQITTAVDDGLAIPGAGTSNLSLRSLSASTRSVDVYRHILYEPGVSQSPTLLPQMMDMLNTTAAPVVGAAPPPANPLYRRLALIGR